MGSFRNLVFGSSRGTSGRGVRPRPARIIFGFQRPGRCSTRCKRSMAATGIRIDGLRLGVCFQRGRGRLRCVTVASRGAEIPARRMVLPHRRSGQASWRADGARRLEQTNPKLFITMGPRARARGNWRTVCAWWPSADFASMGAALNDRDHALL